MVVLLAGGVWAFTAFDILGERIDGNGNVVKQDREVGDFDQLELEGVFDVYIQQGDKPGVTIEADENLIELIQTEVSDGELEIDMDDDVEIDEYTELNVYVTVVDLRDLEIESVGDVETMGVLKLGDIKLDIEGVGDVFLELECNSIDAEVESVGNVDLKGSANRMIMDNSSVGNVDASKLTVGDLELDHNGVGNVEVHGTDKLIIYSSAVGNVYYQGTDNVQIQNEGIGNVSRD